MMTSSPGLTRIWIALKMACLPPTVMMHSLGLYEVPKSAA